MELNLLTAIKNWFVPKEKGLHQGSGTLGALDSEAFKTWFYGLGGDEQAFENLTFPIVAREGFEKNVITYKCVMGIAENIANLTYRLRNKKTKKEIDTHPLLDLWNRPNPLQSQSIFIQHAVADLLLDGNMFLEKVRPSPGKPPRRLWSLQPNWVQITTSTSRIPVSYIYTAGGIEAGQAKTFPVDPVSAESDCLHIKSYAPLRETMNGRGLSPVRSAWIQILTFNAGAAWNYYLLKQSARPAGVLQADGNLTPDQISRLKEQMDKTNGGARGAGKPLVLEGGLKWQEMSLTPVEMAYIEGKNSVARDIALALKTPPILLHIPGDTTYNNVTEAKLAWYEETILPYAQTMVDELNRWLVPDFDPNIELYIDLECISALTERKEAKWQMVQDVDFLTINEKRLQCGFDSLGADGDVVLVPAKTATLQQVAEGELLQANATPSTRTTGNNQSDEEPQEGDGDTGKESD